jgi:hypothetical protein
MNLTHGRRMLLEIVFLGADVNLISSCLLLVLILLLDPEEIVRSWILSPQQSTPSRRSR